MSGRGVITSRTSVSPKSTMLCSSRRSSPSMIPSCSAAVEIRLAGIARLLVRLVVGWRRATIGRVVIDTPARSNHVMGAKRPGDRRERRQQQLQHALGIAADDEQRQQELARSRRTPTTLRITTSELSAPFDADRARQQRGGAWR